MENESRFDGKALFAFASGSGRNVNRNSPPALVESPRAGHSYLVPRCVSGKHSKLCIAFCF